jgi:mono/diheme cytochrome c family protein
MAWRRTFRRWQQRARRGKAVFDVGREDRVVFLRLAGREFFEYRNTRRTKFVSALMWINTAGKTEASMKRTRRAAALVAALVATAASAHAQGGDVAAGHAFARNVCKPCHAVEAEQRVPRRIVIGPAFRDVANAPGMTATAIRVFLSTSHPKMPNLILTPDETEDVIAYILSLHNRRRPH